MRAGYKFKQIIRSKPVRRGLLMAAGLFVVVNVGLWLMYRSRTYPSTSVSGTDMGQISFAEAEDRAKDLKLPPQLSARIKDKSVSIDPAAWGFAVDAGKIARQVRAQRSWAPLYDLLSPHEIPKYVSVDQSAFDRQFAEAAKQYVQPAADAGIVLEKGEFSITPERAGWQLDRESFRRALALALESGKTSATMPTSTIQPKVTSSASLKSDLATIQKQQKTALEYKYQDRTVKISPADLATWFEPHGGIYVVSEGLVRGGLIGVGRGLGIGIKNLDAATAETVGALKTGKKLSFALEAKPPPARVYTYCSAVRGVDARYLPELDSKLAAVFSDARGWNLDGRILFAKADAGCNFTVWLAAAEQMPTFGAICDAEWSCQAGSAVVINFTRWTNASPAWNQAGLGLSDYRTMVINHETGHWLGFGHSNCPGPGQIAPIMQQQSINLQGCAFNPWPTHGEMASLGI